MNLSELVWQVAVPLAGGLAVGFWLRPAARAAITLTPALGVLTFGILVWEACTRQPNLLESLGAVVRPDPVQQTVLLGKATPNWTLKHVLSLSIATYIGFAIGVFFCVASARPFTRRSFIHR